MNKYFKKISGLLFFLSIFVFFFSVKTEKVLAAPACYASIHHNVDVNIIPNLYGGGDNGETREASFTVDIQGCDPAKWKNLTIDGGAYVYSVTGQQANKINGCDPNNWAFSDVTTVGNGHYAFNLSNLCGPGIFTTSVLPYGSYGVQIMNHFKGYLQCSDASIVQFDIPFASNFPFTEPFTPRTGVTSDDPFNATQVPPTNEHVLQDLHCPLDGNTYQVGGGPPGSAPIIPPVVVSCTGSPNPAVNPYLTSQGVQFSASASGGSGGYSYNWWYSKDPFPGNYTPGTNGATGNPNGPVVIDDPSGIINNYYALVRASDSAGVSSYGSCSVTINPAPTIGVDLQVVKTGGSSYENGPALLYYNDPVTLRWTTTGSPTSCTASGDWTGGKSVALGPTYENRGALSNTAKSSYTYTITCNKSGTSNSPVSDSVTVNLQPSLTPILSASRDCTNSPTSVSLSWSSNTSLHDNYRLFRASTAAGVTTEPLDQNFVLVTFPSAAATGYTDTSLNRDLKYWYRLDAVNAFGATPWRGEATAPACPVLPKPDLTATISVNKSNPYPGDSILLTGDITNIGSVPHSGTFSNGYYISDNNGPYNFYQPAGSMNGITTTSAAAPYSWPAGAVDGHTYRFELCADNPNGTVAEESELNNCSTPVAVVVTAVPAVTPMGNISCTVNSSSQITVNWSQTNGTNVSLFRGSTLLPAISGASGSYADSALQPGIFYTYYLRNGASVGSTELGHVSCTTTVIPLKPDLTAAISVNNTSPHPGDILQLSGTVSNSRASFSATFPNTYYVSTDGGSYLLYEYAGSLSGMDATGVNSTKSVTPSTAWTSGGPGSSYRFILCADYPLTLAMIDEGADEGNNCSTPVTVTPVAGPVTTGNVTCTVNSSSQIALNWNQTNGTNVSLFRDSTPLSPISGSSGVYTDSGLQPSTFHTYHLLNGTSVSSTELGQASCTTSAAAAVSPSGSLSCIANSSSQITLNWNQFNGTNVSLFRNITLLQSVVGASGSFVDFSLSPGTTYTYHLRNGATTGSPEIASAASCSTPVIPIKPDLTAAISINNTTPHPGDILQLSGTVSNSRASFSGIFSNTYYVSTNGGSYLSHEYAGSLSDMSASGPNSIKSVNSSTPWTAGPVGNSYSYILCADYPLTLAMIDEADEGNNCSNPVTVTPTTAPNPDLLVSSGPTVSGNLSVGSPLTFSGAITNQGNANVSGGFSNHFKIYLNQDSGTVDDLSPDPGLTGLNVNEVKTVGSLYSWTAVGGTHTIVLCADAYNSITESNGIGGTGESNNCAQANFTIPVASPSPSAPPLSLSVTKNGTGTGTVTSNSPDNKINCGPTCANVYAAGLQVNLTANPSLGSIFTGWSGPIAGSSCPGTGICSFVINQNTQVTATFVLSADPEPDLTAVFSISGTKIPGTSFYEAGKPLNLTGVVRNIGNQSIYTSFKNQFQYSEDPGLSENSYFYFGPELSLSNLASGGAESTISYPNHVTDANDERTYYLRVCADKSATRPDGDISESNPNNNCSPATEVTFRKPIPTVTCAVNPPTQTTTGVPVTWTATAAGGNGTYVYTWTGTDQLSNVSGSITTPHSVNKSYLNPGSKSAAVSVVSGGKSSGVVSCSNSATIIGEVPSLLSATPGTCPLTPTDVTLVWSPPDNNDVVGYKVYRNGIRIDNNELVGKNSTTYVDHTGTPNTSYSYYVKAAYLTSDSVQSNTLNAVTLPVCGVVAPNLVGNAPIVTSGTYIPFQTVNYQAGQPVTIAAVIRNTGNQNITTPFNNQFKFSGDNITYSFVPPVPPVLTLPGLNAGADATVVYGTFTTNAITDDGITYFFKVCADQAEGVSSSITNESSELDNCSPPLSIPFQRYNPANASPSIPTITTSSFCAGTEMGITLHSTDPEGDTITYQYQIAGGLPQDSASGVLTQPWGAAGTKSFTARAHDDEGNASSWTPLSNLVIVDCPVIFLKVIDDRYGEKEISGSNPLAAPARVRKGKPFRLSGTLKIGTVQTSFTTYFSDYSIERLTEPNPVTELTSQIFTDSAGETIVQNSPLVTYILTGIKADGSFIKSSIKVQAIDPSVGEI